jgi:hypothetical protein
VRLGVAAVLLQLLASHGLSAHTEVRPSERVTKRESARARERERERARELESERARERENQRESERASERQIDRERERERESSTQPCYANSKAIYVPAYYYMCPHTTICVPSCSFVCVGILGDFRQVQPLLRQQQRYICVLILLYITTYITAGDSRRVQPLLRQQQSAGGRVR